MKDRKFRVQSSLFRSLTHSLSPFFLAHLISIFPAA
jgi:hypothetical protein